MSEPLGLKHGSEHAQRLAQELIDLSVNTSDQFRFDLFVGATTLDELKTQKTRIKSGSILQREEPTIHFTSSAPWRATQIPRREVGFAVHPCWHDDQLIDQDSAAEADVKDADGLAP